MTKKRFEIIDKHFISYYGGDGHLISNGNCKFWLWHDESGSQKVCDKLNIIMEENIQLKNEISGCKEVNKRLQDYNNRQRAKNERLHSDWDKIYRLCLDKGFTEDEIIKELER